MQSYVRGRDGVWDREEIEAVYGVHHVYSKKKSQVRTRRVEALRLLTIHAIQDDVEHQKKADHIVDTVLQLLDKDNDGKITVDELKVVGLDGLPNFEDLGAEGHHYDVESGMCFLCYVRTTQHAEYWFQSSSCTTKVGY